MALGCFAPEDPGLRAEWLRVMNERLNTEAPRVVTSYSNEVGCPADVDWFALMREFSND